MRATSSLTDRPFVRLSVLRISSRWVRPISASNCWFTTGLLGRSAEITRAPLGKAITNLRKIQEQKKLSPQRKPASGNRVKKMRFFQLDFELETVSAGPLACPTPAPTDQFVRTGSKVKVCLRASWLRAFDKRPEIRPRAASLLLWRRNLDRFRPESQDDCPAGKFVPTRN